MLFALRIFAFDAKTDIVQLQEAIERAYATHDADALAKLITEDFHSISRNGDLRDRNTALALAKSATAPADLK